MSLSAVRDALATRLSAISGLRVYPTPPGAVPELPAAIIAAGEPPARYDQVMGAADVRCSFKVLLLVRSADEAQAWQALEPYISPGGASSVKGAVDGALGGAADWARVSEVPAIGRVPYNGIPYWSATFRVEVYASG